MTVDLLDRRLRLRPDTYWAPVEDRVFGLTPGGPFSLHGAGVAQWLDRLAPALDGTRSLGSLLVGLPEHQAGIVRRLVIGLVERGAVIPVEDPTVRPPDDVGERSAPDPVAATTTRSIGVVGSGELAGRIAEALGALYPAPAPPGEPADLFIRVVDSRTAGRSEEVDDRMQGRLLLSVIEHGPETWVLRHAAEPQLTSADALRRYAALGHDRSTSGGPAPARMVVVAAHIANLAVRLVAASAADENGHQRSSPPGRNRLTVWGTRLGDVVEHSVFALPAPHTAPRTGLAARIAAYASLEPLSREGFSRAAAACADDMCGLIGKPQEADLAQLPLQVSTVAVSDPCGLLGGPASVSAAEWTFETARHRAALDGLACYAGLVVDPACTDSVEGWEVREERVVGLPAELVFPCLRRAAIPSPNAGEHRSPVGTGAGLSWQEALDDAALQHCRLITLAELTRSPGRRRLLHPEALADPDVTFGWAVLDAVGRQVQLIDVTGTLRVPTVLALLDGQPVACAAARTEPLAIAEAVRLAVAADQSERHGQPTYAPPKLPALPGLKITDTGPARLSATAGGPDPLTRLARVRRLAVVPLDRDPALARWLPHLVRLVVLDD